MSTLFIAALWAAGYIAVARGWFLILAGAFDKEFGLDDSDVVFCFFMSAWLALFWPVTGAALALFIAARHILTFGGERTLAEWASDRVRR